MPHLIELAMRKSRLELYRHRTIGSAQCDARDRCRIGHWSYRITVRRVLRRSSFPLRHDLDVVLDTKTSRGACRRCGVFYFAEHGRSPESAVADYKDRLNRLSRVSDDSCCLGRKMTA